MAIRPHHRKVLIGQRHAEQQCYNDSNAGRKRELKAMDESRAYMIVEMNHLPIKTKLLPEAEKLDRLVVPEIEMLMRQAVKTFNRVFRQNLTRS